MAFQARARARTSTKACACSIRSTGAARSACRPSPASTGQLDRMEANGFDVFGESTRLSTPAKLAVVAKGLVR